MERVGPVVGEEWVVGAESWDRDTHTADPRGRLLLVGDSSPAVPRLESVFRPQRVHKLLLGRRPAGRDKNGGRGCGWTLGRRRGVCQHVPAHGKIQTRRLSG
ncbi:MAG: hypothetical protein MK006_14095 [Pirellulales bacterium]|nr:hypothetical protein [Pirellulales bacterium]